MTTIDIEIDPEAKIELIESGMSKYILFEMNNSKVTIKIAEYQLKKIKSL